MRCGVFLHSKRMMSGDPSGGECVCFLVDRTPDGWRGVQKDSEGLLNNDILLLLFL